MRSPILRYGFSVVSVAIAVAVGLALYPFHVMRSYSLGVNAYVVKPVDFHEFVNAVKELGVFWAVINEPPPGSVKK